METARAVREYLDECRFRGLAEPTVAQYCWALERLETGCRKVPCQVKDLVKLLGLAGDLSLESRRDLVKCWRAFFRWLEKRRGVKNPMKDFPPLARRRNLPRVLTELEVGEVLEGARTQRDRGLILLPLDCGLRIGEVAGLRWRDFGPDYVVVRGKLGERIVPVSPGVKRVLLGLGDGEHVWVGKKGPMTRSGVMLAYRRIFARSGIGGAKLGPHTLRHTFGTWYIAGGGNLFALKEIMGHSSVKPTEIYVTLARHQVGQDHALFSPVVVLGLMEKLAEYGGEPSRP